MFVVYNFDSLRAAFADKVLYTLTNYLRKKAFFLILVTEKQDAVQNLEKRIASRVGQSSVKCSEFPFSSSGYWWILRKMILNALEECDCDKEIKEKFKVI